MHSTCCVLVSSRARRPRVAPRRAGSIVGGHLRRAGHHPHPPPSPPAGALRLSLAEEDPALGRGASPWRRTGSMLLFAGAAVLLAFAADRQPVLVQLETKYNRSCATPFGGMFSRFAFAWHERPVLRKGLRHSCVRRRELRRDPGQPTRWERRLWRMWRMRNRVHQRCAVTSAAWLPAARRQGEDGVHKRARLPAARTAAATAATAAGTSATSATSADPTAAQVCHSMGTPRTKEYLRCGKRNG